MSADSSLDIARREISRLGYNYNIDIMGDSLATCRCIITDSVGVEISVGNGKGLGKQSHVSAVCEALEHLFLEIRYLPDDIVFIPISNLDERLREDKVCDLLKSNCGSDIIPCKTYVHISNNEDKLYYPVFLAHPSYVERPIDGDNFDYTRVIRYTTNSGTAVGVQLDEAIIHAVNEIIERDAYSLFLLKTFIRNKPIAIKVIDRDTLPSNILNLVRDVELEMNRPLILIDMTTDLNTPTVCTVPLQDSRAFPYLGFGSSLSREYACERSILEALQTWHLFETYSEDKDQEYEFDTMAVERFKNLPRYQDCIRFDISSILKDERKYVQVSFNDIPYNEPHESVSDYLKDLVENINLLGYDIYYSLNYVSESGFVCVHCIVPGLERFHLVRGGNPIVPGKRGKNVLV